MNLLVDNAPPWLRRAESEFGVAEIPGPQSHPRIIEYLRTCTSESGKVERPGQLGRWAAGRDETPWCAAGLCWALEAEGYPSPGDARARAFLEYGEACGPVLGALTVIRRRRRGRDEATGSSSGYHVGILIRRTDRYVRLYGANQRDAWRYSTYPLSRYVVLAHRWPLGGSSDGMATQVVSKS